jgi:adenylate cyclase
METRRIVRRIESCQIVQVEQRVFLIMDMKNSIAAAERLGEVDFHRLLNRLVTDLSGPVVLRDGQIHKYVGDELIATYF